MNVGVGRLSSHECGSASRLLGRAFAGDPIITYFLYGRLRRRIAFPAFFHAVLEEMLPSGHVYAVRWDGKLSGVAAWLPPNAQQPDAGARRAAARQRALVRMLFPRASQGLFAGFVAMVRISLIVNTPIGHRERSGATLVGFSLSPGTPSFARALVARAGGRCGAGDRRWHRRWWGRRGGHATSRRGSGWRGSWTGCRGGRR